MRKFKAPDLNAPRYREKRLGLLNAKVYKEFKEKHPAYKNVDNTKLKKIITMFHENLWNGVIEHRDGVELPNSLGYLFIGTCEPSKSNNYNFALSVKHGKGLQQRNWETDGNIGKIFYTNWSAKYRFKFRDLWRFEATRKFKRTVAKTYPDNWTKYIFIKTKYRVAHLFKTKKSK